MSTDTHFTTQVGRSIHNPLVITTAPEGHLPETPGVSGLVDLHTHDGGEAPSVPHPIRGRVPLGYDNQGYMEFLARGTVRIDEQGRPLPPTRESLERMAGGPTQGNAPSDVSERKVVDQGRRPTSDSIHFGSCDANAPPRSLPSEIRPEDLISARFDVEGGPASVNGPEGSQGTVMSISPDGTTTERPNITQQDVEQMTSEDFQKLAEQFKNNEGLYQAITAYGTVPLPNEVLEGVPEKFVAKPIVEVRELFVHKQEVHGRVSNKTFTQFEHNFNPVNSIIGCEKFSVHEEVKKIEVPRFVYKPVIEDKVIEIPQGVKYVEVPIEVECAHPPKIVPVGKAHVVERVVETTKPVNQYKIIEIPKIVKEKVPKVITKEIPYVVPKYVEKIIEVPYRPDMSHVPAPQGQPMLYVPHPPPLPKHGDAHAAPGGQHLNVPSSDHTDSSGIEQARQALAMIHRQQLASYTEMTGQTSSGQTPSQATSLIPQMSPQYAQGSPQPPAVMPPTVGGPMLQEIMKLARGEAALQGGSEPSREILGQARIGAPLLPPNALIEPDKVVVSGQTVQMPKAQGSQTIYCSPAINEIKLPYEAKIDVSIVQLDEVPGGVAIAQPGVRFEPPSETPPEPVISTHTNKPYEDTPATRGLFAGCCSQPVEPETIVPDSPPSIEVVKETDSSTYHGFPVGRNEDGIPQTVYAGPMDPIIMHESPGMGHIDFRRAGASPEILTQMGVKSYPWYEDHYDHSGDFLLPPLAIHPSVPFHNGTGVPDIRTLEAINYSVNAHNDGGLVASQSDQGERILRPERRHPIEEEGTLSPPPSMT